MALNKRVTIKQVAEAAGVSTQTVSRVLNNRPDVAQSTRERISEIITSLGFQPSAVARSLIRRRSRTLGVVTAGLEHIGPSRTLNGITAAAAAEGYSLLLQELPGFDTNRVEPILNSLLAHQVDGILWAVQEVADNHAWLDEWLPGLPVPIVFITMQARPGLSVVAVDNRAGGCLATEHLLGRGRRRIAHLAGPQTWWEARQRLAGWREALEAAGLPAPDDYYVEGHWTSQSGAQALPRLLAARPQPDGLFVANDQMALGALLAAYRMGLRVPDDLAIVGFDALPDSAYYWPPLSSVHQHQQKLGDTALHLLAQLIEAQENGAPVQAQAVLLQPELVVRESSR